MPELPVGDEALVETETSRLDDDDGPAGARVAPDPETPETLRDTTELSDGSAADPPPARLGGGGFERYTMQTLLGRGGMGQVHLCRDRTIGRDVAMKLIRDEVRGTRRDLARRFVREARVQGQLEHPAILPVYDVGTRPDGALYFTMKRIRGVSLAEVLRGLRAGDPELSARYSQRRLLTVLSNVCMAVHFAHEKGVVHRDLKPANLMLGAFGEVYVLDWGLAALGGAGDSALEPVDDEQRGETLAGGMMGTPGYMAPEQIRDPATVDARADLYALGAILFEILTLERLNGEGAPADALCATLERDDVSPAARTPERAIPPELDRLCRAATRLDRAQRTSSAAELSRAIEAFLDGDRDLALRQKLARAHLDAAETALDGTVGKATPEARARAVREVTAALGLDPDNRAARQMLVRLITEPAETIPVEVEQEMAAGARVAVGLAGRGALLFYAGYVLYLPLLLWMGVRDWQLFALGWALIAACAAATALFLRRLPSRPELPLSHLALSTVTVAMVSVLFGPHILVPMLAVGMCVSYTASVGHARGMVPVASCLAILVPALLQGLGVVPSSNLFSDGRWTVLPTVFHISPLPTQIFLVVAGIGTVVPACLFVAQLRGAYLDAQRKLQVQAWQLRQIVPPDA